MTAETALVCRMWMVLLRNLRYGFAQKGDKPICTGGPEHGGVVGEDHSGDTGFMRRQQIGSDPVLRSGRSGEPDVAGLVHVTLPP